MANLPQSVLKIIVVVHFILTIWASQCGGLMPMCYTYMNMGVLGIGVWAVASPDSVSAVSLMLVLHVFSILEDIILLGIYQPRAHAAYERTYIDSQTPEYRFSLGMAIVNLIIKPVTVFLMFRVFQDRGGSLQDFRAPAIPNLSAGGGGGGPIIGRYEDIDSHPPPSGGYHHEDASAPTS